MKYSINEEKINAKEYIEFLSRTDLGKQYPKERFEKRIETLVNKTNISLIIRNEDNIIIGVLFALTDFAYWLFITDLGIDRNYIKMGLGKELINKAQNIAGGKQDIAVYTCVNDKAIPFYEKCGFKTSTDVMERNEIDWTYFEVEKK